MKFTKTRIACATLWTMILAICCILWISKPVQADSQDDYTYEVTDDKATITDYTGSDTSFTIPSQLGGYDVTAIADQAFKGKNIVSVEIPSTVTSIGKSAFGSCTELTSVILPDTIKYIANGTFYGCKKLDNVTIPYGVTYIASYAFCECESLKNISFPSTLKSIYTDAFTACSSLSGFTVPLGLSSLDPNAFAECTALQEFKVVAGNQYYTAVDGVLFNKDQTTLVLYPSGKKNTVYQVPSCVNTIGEYAFSYTAVTQKVYIPATVTTFSSNSFCELGSQFRLCVPSGSVAETFAQRYGIVYNNDSYVPVTGLDIGGDSTVEVSIDKKTYQLNVQVVPSNASDQTITYTSTSPALATVSNTGLVTLKAYGIARITATCGVIKKTVDIKITEAEATPAPEDSSATTAPTTPTTPTAVKTNIADKAITVHLSATSYVYNGGYKKPVVKVYYGKTPIASSNYKVAYSNNKSIGTAKVTVTGINQCYGSKTVTFKIVPPTVTKVKLSGKKKSVSASWGKVSSATGYQVYYSTKKASGYKCAKSIASNKTVKYKISKLSAKKTYYIRIRAYKKVGKTVYYGAFSAAKKVKTK